MGELKWAKDLNNSFKSLYLQFSTVEKSKSLATFTHDSRSCVVEFRPKGYNLLNAYLTKSDHSIIRMFAPWRRGEEDTTHLNSQKKNPGRLAVPLGHPSTDLGFFWLKVRCYIYPYAVGWRLACPRTGQVCPNWIDFKKLEGWWNVA